MGPGRGATFLVRLPGARTHGIAPASLAGSDVSLAGAHVLVVEDQADGRDARRADHHGALAAAFRQPRAQPRRSSHSRGMPPDLVISDIAMPGMDGYELLTRLRALEAGRRVPAIALDHLRARRRQDALAARRIPGARAEAGRSRRTAGHRGQPAPAVGAVDWHTDERSRAVTQRPPVVAVFNSSADTVELIRPGSSVPEFSS